MLWWVSVVREWVTGFNTVSVWAGLWVDRCVRGGGSGEFRGGGCGCCWWVWWVWASFIIIIFLLLLAVVVAMVVVIVVVGACGCDGCV